MCNVCGNFDVFLDRLEALLNKINTLCSVIVVAGDFTINFFEKNERKEVLCALMSSFNLQQVVDLPTRGNNCIANVFITSDTICYASPLDIGLSDHRAIDLKIRLSFHYTLRVK